MTRAAILGIDIEYIDGTRKTFDRNEVNMAFGYPKLTRGYTPPAGLISAFSASSSMGAVQYASFRFLENAEIKPAGGRRVRQRPLPCPARRLNDVYRAYAERKATQQDTQTALS